MVSFTATDESIQCGVLTRELHAPLDSPSKTCSYLLKAWRGWKLKRNLKDYLGRLKGRKRPLVLAINGRAELGIQDAESYQALLERLDRAETVAAIRQGMKQIARGEGMSLKQAKRGLRKKLGFSRSDRAPSFQRLGRDRRLHQAQREPQASRRVVQRNC